MQPLFLAQTIRLLSSSKSASPAAPVGLIQFRGHFLKGGYDVHNGKEQRSPGDPAGSLMTSLRQARSGWCLMRARAWVGWPGSLTSPNRRFATGSVRPGPIGRRAGRA